MRYLLCGALLLVAGCPDVKNAEEFRTQGGALQRASFEMKCPSGQLKVVDIGEQGRDKGTVGVSGCGKQSVYVYVWGTGWVANTDSAAK